MDFNSLIAELRASSDNLPKDSADRSLLSSVYCNKACKVLDEVAESTDYDTIITGLWLVTAHFAEQLAYLKPVPALSELCFKLFRQCAKAVLNIQWQNLEEDSSLRQNFLASLANLHAKLVPFDFPRFRLLEGLTENPWTNPTLAKVMGGEVEDGDKEEVRTYIEQEDPIILQLRVDMMLQENCEEYALNLCNNCLSHPELQSDLGVRKTQLSLLYKLGQEDKLQEECQKLNIQDAVRIIKQLQTSETHRQICTVLAQTFMVQNWIRPSDMEANKELLRLWIRHQLLVDREHDQFKESVWAMAKLSQSTEQIVIFIDVLREECGEIFLQLYVDMCIFAINVDKGQMETNKKEGNMEAAAARRSDMASICAKLACLCHHASVKVARICALTSFALKPTEQSFVKIGTFYGQGTDCCNKCGRDRNREPGTINPATLYEVERLLNMLRPDYLSPDQSYTNIQILCRRFLQESLKNAQQLQRQQMIAQNSGISTLIGGSKITAAANRPTNVFEALSPQDFHNTQMLLNRMRIQSITHMKASIPGSPVAQHRYKAGSSGEVEQGEVTSPSLAGHANKPQYMFDVEKIKRKQPYGVPVEQQHQYYLMKHEKELEQRRKNSQKKREEKAQKGITSSPQVQQWMWQQQQNPKQHSEVNEMIQTALQDSSALQKITQSANPGIVQAVINIMKGSVGKAAASADLQQQTGSQQIKPTGSPSQQVTQPLPTVSTLLKPSVQTQKQQNQEHVHAKQQQSLHPSEQSPPRRHPRPQLYAQPIVVSTASSVSPQRYQPSVTSMVNRNNSSAVSLPGEKQKGEGFVLAKSHVEDIRRFMQMQMSNLQQKQVAEPRQMSGSTVTLKNASSANTSFGFTNRPKTTVQLAEQAALAKLQKHGSSKPDMLQQSQQLASNSGQMFMPKSKQALPKPGQRQQFTPSMNRMDTIHHQHQQKLLQSPHQQVNSFCFQNSPTSNVNSNQVLPSDELSGSIMGIDDTIIKELLQDSGILANTFPDIDVETVAEDKSKYSSLPQSAIPNQMSKSSHPQLYNYTNPPVSQTHYTAQGLPASIPASQPHKAASASQQSSSRAVNKYSLLPAVPCSGTVSHSPLNPSISRLGDRAIGSHPSWADMKSNACADLKENTSFLFSIKNEIKPTVDQLREIMKKEDIEGEVCMDAANNATYRCIICSIAFESLDHLREHVRNVCKPGLQSSSVYNTKIKQDRANSAKAGVETTTVFQCLRCFELCVSDAGIKQHRLTCKRVPTVPSDLKKENVNNKQRVMSKSPISKLPPKKVPKDEADVTPELPIPLPDLSLYAETVLKNISQTGPLISQTLDSSIDTRRQTQESPSHHLIDKSNIATSTPFPNTLSNTSAMVSTALPVSSSLTSCLTATSQLQSSSLSVNIARQTPICSGNISTSDTSMEATLGLPSDPAETYSASVVQRELESRETKAVIKEDPETIPQPNFTEITGSGGSKFYKCGLCSQTLCSHESFLVHWKECAVKNKNLIKKLELKEKACSAKPISGEVLENLIGVIADVAAGSGSIPECISLDSEFSDVGDYYGLRDPCKAGMLDMEESSGYPDSDFCYDFADSNSQEDMSEDGVETGETGDGSVTGSACTDTMDVSKDGENECEKDTDEGIKEGEVDESTQGNGKHSEETDDGRSEGESEQSYVSTRKAPPKLRDRKTLKPIHSFINETFNSPFSKTAVNLTNAKTDEILKDETEESREKQVSESEVESDGDSLYCKVCRTSFQTKRILLQHFAGKHLQPYTVKTVADSSSYFCHLCQKTYSTFMHYMQHVPNHSVTIYEKMRAFIASKKSQRSQRIALQRGLDKKAGINPKMSKGMKSKKAASKSAVDRLEQQLLAGKTQAVRERMKISKRKRSLQSAFTSSEDDFSSDASNNVVFKSKKLESENMEPMNTARPKRSTSQLHQTGHTNSLQSFEQSEEEESDGQGPRLARDQDDDYVLSEEIDSDSMDSSIAPRTTRSRNRINLNPEFDSKTGSVELNKEVFGQEEINSLKCLPDKVLADYDADSNCSDLLLSQCQNGHFVPTESQSDTQGRSCEASSTAEDTRAVESSKELIPGRTLIVRSLNRRLKERLKSCDLHPTVVLKPLQLDIAIPHKQEVSSPVDAVDHESQNCEHAADSSSNNNFEEEPEPSDETSQNEAATSAAVKAQNSSFLESFLSYLNQYPSHTKIVQVGRKRCRSGPPRVRGFRKRRRSIDLSHLQETDEEGQNNLRHSSSLQLDASQNMSEPEANTGMESSGSLQDAVKSILCKIPTRKCSVNLGQKMSLEELKANQDLLARGVVQEKPTVGVAGHKESTEVMTITDSPPLSPQGKCVPISLEPFEKMDIYASKLNIPTNERINMSRTCKPVKRKKQSGISTTDNTDIPIAKGQTQDKHFLDNISTCLGAAQPPHAQLRPQHFTSKSQSELTGSICTKLRDKIKSSVQSCSFQSKFEELALKASKYPEMLETCGLTPPSSEVISPEPRFSDIESSDLVSIDIRSSQSESLDIMSSNLRPGDLRSVGMGFSNDGFTDVESLENGTSDNPTSDNTTPDSMTSNNGTSGNWTSNNEFSDNKTSDGNSLKYQDLSRQKYLESSDFESEKQSINTVQNDIVIRSSMVTYLNEDSSVKVSDNLEGVCPAKPRLCSNNHSTQSLMLKNEGTVMVADMSDSGHVHCSVVSGAGGVSSEVADNVVVNLIEEDVVINLIEEDVVINLIEEEDVVNLIEEEDVVNLIEDDVVGSVTCQADVPCVGASVSAPSGVVGDEKTDGTHPTAAVQEGESPDPCTFVGEETSVGVVSSSGKDEHQSSMIAVSAETNLTCEPHHELDSQSHVYDTIDGQLETHWAPQDDPGYWDYVHIEQPDEEPKAVGGKSTKIAVSSETDLTSEPLHVHHELDSYSHVYDTIDDQVETHWTPQDDPGYWDYAHIKQPDEQPEVVDKKSIKKLVAKEGIQNLGEEHEGEEAARSLCDASKNENKLMGDDRQHGDASKNENKLMGDDTQCADASKNENKLMGGDRQHGDASKNGEKLMGDDTQHGDASKNGEKLMGDDTQHGDASKNGEKFMGGDTQCADASKNGEKLMGDDTQCADASKNGEKLMGGDTQCADASKDGEKLMGDDTQCADASKNGEKLMGGDTQCADTSNNGEKLMGDDTQCGDSSVVVVSDSEKVITCDKADISVPDKDSSEDHEAALESCLAPGVESSHNMESTSGVEGVRMSTISDQSEGNTELAVEVHENDQVCDEIPVGDISQVASFTERAADTEGDISQVVSFTQIAADTEGDSQVDSFTEKAADTEGDISQVVSFTERAADTEGNISLVDSFTEKAADTEGDSQVVSFTERAADTEGDISQVDSFAQRAVNTEGNSQVNSFIERAADTEGDISQVVSFTERAADTEVDSQTVSFTETAAEDMKTQLMGSNNISRNTSSQQDSASNEMNIETNCAADKSSPSIDASLQTPGTATPSSDTSTPNVSSSSSPSSKCSEDPLRPESDKERKQDYHARTNFNSSISLAAFIAERLTKEDLEPTSAFKRNVSDKASFRLIGEDAPLDIGSHRMEATGMNYVGCADIISPLSSYAGVKEYMDETYITPVVNNFSINFGHYIGGHLNIGRSNVEQVTSTYVMSIDSPSTHIDHGEEELIISKSRKSPSTHIDHSEEELIISKSSESPSTYINPSGQELIISKYIICSDSPSTHIDHSRMESDELASIGPVNIGSDDTEPVRPVYCEALDISCELKVADDGKSSNAVHGTGLVDYSSSDEEEDDISNSCGHDQEEPNRKQDHEGGTSRQYDSQEGTSRQYDSQEGTSRKHDSQEGTSRQYDSQEGTGTKRDNQEKRTSTEHDHCKEKMSAQSEDHKGEANTKCDNHTKVVNHVISLKAFSESNDLQSHKSQISEVLTANLTSEPRQVCQADCVSNAGCARSSTGHEQALQGDRLESKLRASNRLKKESIEHPTPIAAQSENSGLLGHVLESNPGVNDFHSYRHFLSSEGVKNLSDRHPESVVECTRSVQEKGNSQVFSQRLGNVSNDVTEDLSQDIPLCVSPYSSQNVPVYMKEDKSNEDIPACVRKENFSEDLSLCENREKQSQDIHMRVNNKNSQKTVVAGSTGNNDSLSSLQDTGCKVAEISQAGSGCSLQECYIEHRLHDSQSVDNSANLGCHCMRLVSQFDGPDVSTSASAHDGHCQLVSYSKDTLVGPRGGLTSSRGVGQCERVTGLQVDSRVKGLVMGSRLAVASLSARSHTDILAMSGKAHDGVKGGTVDAQSEASHSNECTEHVQTHVASRSSRATEGPGICVTTDCELSQGSLEKDVSYVVPEKSHKESGNCVKCLRSSSKVSEVNVGTGVCCEVFTDNIRVNSFDMQSHRRNQEKPGEQERSGTEFQAGYSDRDAHVMECGPSRCQNDYLSEEEVQLLSPVFVDSGTTINESVAAVSINYAAEVILSRCDAPGCNAIGSRWGSSPKTSRERSLLVPSVCEETIQASGVARSAAVLQQASSCSGHVENKPLACSDAVRQSGSTIDKKILVDMPNNCLCFKKGESTSFKQISGSSVSAKGISSQVFHKLTGNLSVEATDCEISLDTGLASLSEFKVDSGMKAKITASVKSTKVPSLVCSRSMRRLSAEDTADVGRTIVEDPVKAESDLLEKKIQISERESSLVQGSNIGRGHNQLREPSRIIQLEMFDAHFKQPECDIQSNTSCYAGHDSHGISNKCNVTYQNTENPNSDASFEARLQSVQLDSVASLVDSSEDNNNSGEASRPGSPRERVGTDHETDDGDDLSDFDLIIEKDTSYRNLVSFPVTSDKRSYSSASQHPISPYISRGKIPYVPLTATSSILTSGFTYSKIPTADGHQSLQGQQVSFTSRKSLATAKTCRKSHRQFVWEVEDESGGGNTQEPRAAVVAPTSSLATRHKIPAIQQVSDPSLDILRRKQKALREKSETAPFTWDLDDNADGSVIRNSIVKVRRPNKKSSDIISFEKSGHGRNVTTPANKVCHLTPHKRPLTPDVPPGKMPAKFRRTFSVDRQVRDPGSSAGKELKRRGDRTAKEVSNASSVKYPSQKLTSDSQRSKSGSQRSVSDSQRSISHSQRSTTDSVTVDEDISFKKDSFSPPCYSTVMTDIQISQAHNILCVSSHEAKGKRGERSQKHSHFSLALDGVVQECRLESYGHFAEEDPLKSSLGLRSRHSSMESNRSDKSSLSTKRAADNNSPFPSKRSRRSEEDSSSPKLKKIGLIKVTKDSLSSPSATGSDATAPMTRSSEAAIKAFNQKSLRSRGVNLCPLAAISSSAAPRQGPQTTPPKSSPESSSRLKSSISPQKQSSQLSVTLRHSSIESKIELSPKSSLRKLRDESSVAGTVIKRRSPSSPASSSSSSSPDKTLVSLRSRKSLAELSKHGQPTVSVSVVRVKPVPSITLTKETCKSLATPSSKESRALHSALTTSTASVKSKRDHIKQQNWRIRKDTKLSAGKKQMR